MMKSIKNILLLAIPLLVFSCKKVTEQIPLSNITPANFYKTASDADNAINACYDALQQSPSNYVIWGDGRTDMLANTDRSSSADLQVNSGNVAATNGYVGWGSLYAGINRCNSVLKNVPGITDPALAGRRDRILGEAYFLRALFYFYLTRTFENAPLILEPYESLGGDFFPKVSSRQLIFEQVEKDLKLAETLVPDLPFSTTLENKGKATKAAVRSTLADLYLWQKKYQQAADMAALVISSPANYSLVQGANFAAIFRDKNTTESIFEVQYNYTYQEGNTNNLSEQFLPLGGSITAGNLRYQPSDAVLAALPATDNRAGITYRNTGSSPAPYRDANKLYIAKYPGTLVGNILYQDANRMVYRLAEVILFRAEALNELGRPEQAIPLLNQIRARAGIGPTAAVSQAEVRLAIERERFAELAFEGKRYYDLVRTGRYAAVTGFTDPNYLRWPLPASELIRNPNLVQNPGY
ncbi:RagB/SusD family nutrient uptake outer membrane protein [Pedobacter yulinensis]|nr:RagB/SusD family nutrient uptake outer membrane protein [Pedobacter yulinensis]